MVYFNNYLYDIKRPQLPEHPSTRPGAIPTGSHPSGLPLPTPMGGQGLMNRAPMWPSSTSFILFKIIRINLFLVSAPGHPGPYYNQYHQPRQPRPPFMYPGPGGPMNRPP